MRALSANIAILLILLLSYALVFNQLETTRKAIKREDTKGMTLPPFVLEIISLEYKTLVADFLFVRASQFYGGKVAINSKPTQEDWDWLYQNLDTITELDPYFQDPYYMGNGLLTWDAQMYDEANTLLQKGADARDWDWWIPFLSGFNKFYFQGKFKEGADDLLTASKRPGAWPVLPTLAARLYYNEGRTQTAITFLSALIKNEKDKKIRINYERRLDALKKIHYLETGVNLYKDKMGVAPRDLKQLIDYRIIKSIPKDPYGGQFYVDKDGSIKTTSKLAFSTLQREKKKE